MRTHLILRRLANTLLIVGLLSGFMQPIARAQEIATPPADTREAYVAAVNEMSLAGG